MGTKGGGLMSGIRFLEVVEMQAGSGKRSCCARGQPEGQKRI